MKLISQTSREYKGKKYSKFWVIIPNTIIEKLGWKTGDSLELDAEHGKLIIDKEGHTHTTLKAGEKDK
jgi:bifunctional DNA-binding transcriptional regulator/antitoxin component of YhaV-PrlF toxin-antitoxin module